MQLSHLRITQASLVSAFTFIVGQVVAFVPSLAADQEVLISAGTAVIAAVFLIANAVHHLADSNIHGPDAHGISDIVRDELGKVNIRQVVGEELKRILGQALAQPGSASTAGQAAAPAASTPTASPQASTPQAS